VNVIQIGRAAIRRTHEIQIVLRQRVPYFILNIRNLLIRWRDG
jgi:hypothetical protein